MIFTIIPFLVSPLHPPSPFLFNITHNKFT